MEQVIDGKAQLMLKINQANPMHLGQDVTRAFANMNVSSLLFESSIIRIYLNCNQRYGAIEKIYDVVESTCYILSKITATMIKLRVPFPFNIPIFDSSDDVTLIRSAKL